MIFLVGGACQGKGNAAKNLVENRRKEAGTYVTVDAKKESFPVGIQEKKIEILEHVHLLVKRKLHEKLHENASQPHKDAAQKACMEAEILGEVWENLQTVICENRNLVITMDEVGNGVVPMEYSERAYREIVGRLGCRLAQQAEEVYVVVCGIAKRIK